jgi:hypothetical protein
MKTQTGLIAPVIHLNGTSSMALLEAVDGARKALIEAQGKLDQAAPHGRDYPEEGTYDQAAIEHVSRVRRLASIKRELDEVLEALFEQEYRKRLQKRWTQIETTDIEEADNVPSAD